MSEDALITKARSQLQTCNELTTLKAGDLENPFTASRNILRQLLNTYDTGGEMSQALAGMALQTVVPEIHVALAALGAKLNGDPK